MYGINECFYGERTKNYLQAIFDYLRLSLPRLYLTLKVPNKNCSRRHFNFLLLSFEENRLEISSLIFSEKKMKKYL